MGSDLLSISSLFVGNPGITRRAAGEGKAINQNLEVWNARLTAFKICTEPDAKQPQAYALCASTRCFTIINVAFCKCFQKVGNSTFLPFFYTNNQPPVPGPIWGDICDLMEVSDKGDFLASRFSPPPQLQRSYEGLGALAGSALKALRVQAGHLLGCYR